MILETIYNLFLWIFYIFRVYSPFLFITVVGVVVGMIWFGPLDATYIASISDGRPALGFIIYPKLGVLP